MKILLTGSKGQLAKEILAQAVIRKDEVMAYDRAGLNISDFKAVSLVVEEAAPEVIINCAAMNDVDGAETRW